MEQYFNETGGEITDENDLIWKQTELDIKDKIDSYGFVLDGLDAQENKLKEFQDKFKLGINKINTARERLKRRLNDVATRLGEAHLRGNVYSFHPFESSRRVIEHPELLKDNEIYLTVEIRKDYWDRLFDSVKKLELTEDLYTVYKIISSKGKISELSEGHPAVETINNPSVRIT